MPSTLPPKHVVCYDNLRMHWMRFNWFSFHSSVLMFPFAHTFLSGSHIVRNELQPLRFFHFVRDVVYANATSTWLNNWSVVEHCLMMKMICRRTRQSHRYLFHHFIDPNDFIHPLLIVMFIIGMILLLLCLLFGMCHATYIIGTWWLFFGQFAYCNALDSLCFRRNSMKKKTEKTIMKSASDNGI